MKIKGLDPSPKFLEAVPAPNLQPHLTDILKVTIESDKLSLMEITLEYLDWDYSPTNSLNLRSSRGKCLGLREVKTYERYTKSRCS